MVTGVAEVAREQVAMRTAQAELNSALLDYGPSAFPPHMLRPTLALAFAQEDMEEDDGPLAKRDPWEKFGTRLHPDEEVTVRVHAVRAA